MPIRLLGLIAICTAAALGCQQPAAPTRAQFVRTIPWASRGVWLKADTHVHTRFSDGGLDLDEVVRGAYRHGCDVLAITDHADSGLQATSDEYFEALATARARYPDLILLAGLEWNVPPWHGREHAAVLVPPGPRETSTLREFQVRFDDWQRESRDPQLAQAALKWLHQQGQAPQDAPVVFYNHPFRKREPGEDLVAELADCFAAGPVMVGFEGGPGHQDSKPIGVYQLAATIDRWDPAAAEVGGAWDKMLARGMLVWGALATSDFHNADPQAPDDYWPGEFSETWLYAENRSPRAVLAALRAGSFFGVHGHIARSVQLRVMADGLPRPALVGESIQAAAGTALVVSLELEMPLLDWQDKPNLVDEVELIAIAQGEAKVVARQRPALSGPALQVVLPMPPGGLTLRARGRRIVEDGPDLMFYTNPIRITADAREGGLPSQMENPSDRRMPAWVYLLLLGGAAVLLSLIDRWRVEIGRRFAVSGQPAPPPDQTLPHALQRHLLVALGCCIALAVYGSLVPFDWKQQTALEATREFGQILQQPLSLSSKTDWATNVVLFLPIGFLATGVSLGRIASDRRRLLVPPGVVLGCIALSLAVEFGQLWVDERYCSQNDIVAEGLGGLLGVAAWLTAGSSVASWLDAFSANRRPRQRLERMLEVYLLAAFALALLPLDLTLRPAELHDKWQQGRISLLPFADLQWSIQSAVQLLEKTLLLLPLGVLAAIWRWPRETDVRPLRRSLVLGLGMLAAIEAAQLLVFSRHSSVTDLITGMAAIAAGWSLVRWHAGSSPRRATLWVLVAAGYALLLAAVFWLPLDRVSSPAEVAQRWRAFLTTPVLAMFQQGDITNAVNEAYRKLMLFGILGSLLAMAATRRVAADSPRRWQATVAAAVVGLLFAAGIELAQLWLPPHIPDWSDLILMITGCGVGLFAMLAVNAYGPVHKAT